jgi:ATP-dependent DNA ligase
MRDLRNEFSIDAPRCRGGYLETLPEGILGNPDYALEIKEDGTRITMQIGAERSLLVGRNRQDFLKGVQNAGPFRDLSHENQVLSAFAVPELDGTVLDGELTESYNQDGFMTKSTRRRRDNGEYVGYTVWGVLFYKYRDVRSLPDDDRFRLASQIVYGLVGDHKSPMIRMVKRFPCTEQNLEKIFMAGFEGGIAKHRKMPIPANQRTNSWWWKLKGNDKRTVDAFVVGASEASSGGSGLTGIKPTKNGKAATFTIAMVRDGQVVEVGKMTNLPKDARANGLSDFGKYKFRVAELVVSGWDGERFRWPRFKKWREDKSPSDCIFTEQV